MNLYSYLKKIFLTLFLSHIFTTQDLEKKNLEKVFRRTLQKQFCVAFFSGMSPNTVKYHPVFMLFCFHDMDYFSQTKEKSRA